MQLFIPRANFQQICFSRDIRIANKLMGWKTRREFLFKRRLIISATSGNTAMLVEDPFLIEARLHRETQRTHMVTVSANTGSPLKPNAQAWLLFLRCIDSCFLTLCPLSYSASNCRTSSPSPQHCYKGM